MLEEYEYALNHFKSFDTILQNIFGETEITKITGEEIINKLTQHYNNLESMTVPEKLELQVQIHLFGLLIDKDKLKKTPEDGELIAELYKGSNANTQKFLLGVSFASDDSDHSVYSKLNRINPNQDVIIRFSEEEDYKNNYKKLTDFPFKPIELSKVLPQLKFFTNEKHEFHPQKKEDTKQFKTIFHRILKRPTNPTKKQPQDEIKEAPEQSKKSASRRFKNLIKKVFKKPGKTKKEEPNGSSEHP